MIVGPAHPARTAHPPSPPRPRLMGGGVVVTLALHALLLLTAPATGAAQGAPGVAGARPLVTDIDFPGADELDTDALAQGIATRVTRCRGLLLTPLCWLTDWHVIVDRQRLDPAELPRDELRLQVMYFREGFREAEARFEVTGDTEESQVSFHVDEGPATTVGELEIHQVEEQLSERDIRRARLPQAGERLSLVRLEDGLTSLSQTLAERGYLDVVVRDSVSIGPGPYEARVEITVDPGPRTTVREIEVVGNQEIERSVILNGLLFEEGDVLTTALVREARTSLHASNLFHEVDISVPPMDDSAKVLRIRVREAPPRLGRIGGGFNTLEFAQVEARFSHFNLRGGGRRMDVRGSLGNLFAGQLNGRGPFRDVLPGGLSDLDDSPFVQPTWQASVDFLQPHFRAAENAVGGSVFSHRRMIPGVSVDRGTGAEASATRRLAWQTPLSLSYRFEVTSVEADEVFFCANFGLCEPSSIQAVRGDNRLSPVSLSIYTDRSDDPLAPTTGYRARLDLEHASGPTQSDYQYHRIAGEASYYLPLGPHRDRVIATRTRFGWVEALEGTADALGLDPDALALLHPRKRFFAGGARSVRGFAENQLGPLILTVPRERLLQEDICSPQEINEGTCDPSGAPVDFFFPRPVGGTSLLEASVEFRFPVWIATGAVFVDAARLGEGRGGFLENPVEAVTPGFGMRFPSPVGPIRIDLGLRPQITPTAAVLTERMVGENERELIRLGQRRVYDPAEDEGFVGRLLNRLTLHFSIGEAF